MTRTIMIKLAFAAALVLGTAGCVYEPAPYYGAAPAPAYYGYSPAPAYYYGGPTVAFGFRGGGGGWHHHGDRD